MTTINVSTELIDEDAKQVRRRFGSKRADELAASVKAIGLISPITIRKAGDRYTVICGARRLRAAKQAGHGDILAIVRDADETQIRVMQLVENIQRSNLALPDLGDAVSSLVENIGFSKTCAELSRSPKWVSMHSRIKNLPKPVRDAIGDGRIKDVDTAHDVAKVQRTAPAKAAYMLRNDISRETARRAKAELASQDHDITTYDLLSGPQRHETCRRFLQIMENYAMAPALKMAAMLELLRDAQKWSGA